MEAFKSPEEKEPLPSLQEVADAFSTIENEWTKEALTQKNNHESH